MWNLQWCISYLSCLLTEDGTKKSLLCCQLSLSLWSNLSNEDITGTNLCADSDDTILIKILEDIIWQTCKISCDLLLTKLGITSLTLVFLYMNWCVYIILYKSLAEKNRILVVVTFPCHETDQWVLTKCDLSARCWRAICDNLSSLYVVTLEHDRSLVHTVTLVASCKLDDVIYILCSILICSYTDLCAVWIFYNAVSLGNDANTWIYSSLCLHTCSNHCWLCHHKRNRLTLHVWSHEGTVSIIVLKEWDHRCSNWEYHLRWYIHEINLWLRELGCISSESSWYIVLDKVSILIYRLISLYYSVSVLLVCCKVNNLICNNRVRRICLIKLSIWSLNETILVDTRICSQWVDKSDVRTLRGLDRTHSTVVCIVYISDLESGSVSWKSTRTKGWKSSLMSQFWQRVILIHKLWQLWTSEELLNSSRYRLDIDKGLRCDRLSILCCHSLSYNSLKSWKTDSILVLKKFSNRSDTSVAQMVDVIVITNAILEVNVVIYGSKYVFLCNMLWYEVWHVSLYGSLELLCIIAILLEESLENRIIYSLHNAKLSRIKIHIVGNVDHHIRKNLNVSLLCLDHNIRNCCILNCVCKLLWYCCSSFSDNLSCARIDSILSKDMSCYTSLESKLLVELVTSNLCKIVSSRIKEHSINKALCILNYWRLVWSDLLVKLYHALCIWLCRILVKTLHDLWLLAK